MYMILSQVSSQNSGYLHNTMTLLVKLDTSGFDCIKIILRHQSTDF